MTDLSLRYEHEEVYKKAERRARLLIGNAMKMLLEANGLREKMAAMIQPGGEAELAAELAKYQMTRNDPPDQPGATAALLDKIAETIDGLHQLLWMMESVSLAAGGGAVFGVPPYGEQDKPATDDGTGVLPPAQP